MPTKFLELGSAFTYSLRLTLPKVDYNDFNCNTDILIIGNFLTSKELFEAKSLLAKGSKFVFNNLWEVYPDINTINIIKNYNNCIRYNGYSTNIKQPNTYQIPMFYWYVESLENQKHLKVSRQNFSKKFLMPINNQSYYRDLLINELNPELENSIYSYCQRGKYLPNDMIPFDYKHINREWYEQTCFTLVIETDQTSNNEIFLTEKTFKPISLAHPFMIYGHSYSLELLRNNGFKTFSNMFDESYDKINDPIERLKEIKNQIINFDSSNAYVDEDVLEHNYNHYYNYDLVKSKIETEIIQPLKDFING